MDKVYVQEVSAKNQANGYAGLDGTGKLPSTLLPPFDGQTSDTGDHYRVILLSNGTVKAIPFATPVPTVPQSFSLTSVKLSSVHMAWSAPVTSASPRTYAIWRSGAQIGTTTALVYRDTTVVAGNTYQYQVQTIDPYGQRSPKTAQISAFIDPALNVNPTISVHAWPPQLNTIGKTILRVNSTDVDAQIIARTLSVDVGTITPTQDPSVWMYTP